MQNTAETVTSNSVNTLSGFQLSRLTQAVEGLTTEQLNWASGYLAGLGTEPTAPLQNSNIPNLTILYASQGGNARSVAEKLAVETKAHGYAPHLVSAENYKPRDLSKEKILIAVISTQGEGEPPENARELFRYLNSKKPLKLYGLKYAIFGLGDSSYELFCQAGKELDQLLKTQGAKPLVERIDADIDFDSQTDEWFTQILTVIEQELPTDQVRVIPLQQQVTTPRYNRNHTYRAKLLENRRITTQNALSSVYHLALEIDPDALRYQPGDALGVLFRNDSALVEEILSLTGLSGDTRVNLQGKSLTLSKALSEKLELTQLHPTVVAQWALLTDHAELSILTRHNDQLRSYARKHQFINLLNAFPAPVEASDLAHLLRPLQPRFYSIASSQSAYDDEIHLTVSKLQYHAHGRDHLGGASGYLTQRIDEGDALEIYVAGNPNFRLPQNGDTDIIMIGAGTGIAPFRAFLQEREAQGAGGANWLIFGNRHFHRDFLYQTDWLKYRKADLLNRLSLAFSRDTAEHHYVQDRLLAEGKELYRWLQDGACIYVCGGLEMEKSVYQSLITVAERHGGSNRDTASELIEDLRSQGRYLRDVY